MPEIKMKNTIKDIKILDKTSNPSKNMKNAYVRTKKSAEETNKIVIIIHRVTPHSSYTNVSVWLELCNRYSVTIALPPPKYTLTLQASS